MATYTHLLLATDFMPEAEQLGARARELAHGFGARLSLVHVLEPSVLAPPYEMMPSLPDGTEQALEEAAQQALDRLGEQLEVPSVSRHLLYGSVRRAVADFVTDHQVDLVLVGSHGRHGVERLLGSTASAILQAAPCDVLALRLDGQGGD
ncbi:universal stress protein [Thiohalospira sp.]|uniref:universal stress protein n=1 Tax=Thiohalospira sp. TaxID=3080549 RepID=UPI00397FFAD4